MRFTVTGVTKELENKEYVKKSLIKFLLMFIISWVIIDDHYYVVLINLLLINLWINFEYSVFFKTLHEILNDLIIRGNK